MQRELAEVRALTEAWPLVYVDDPVEELFWRRPLAEQRRKADEAAREEEARKERDAEQARLTYERRQRDEESDRAQRIAAAHTTLTAAERQEEDALRKDWAKVPRSARSKARSRSTRPSGTADAGTCRIWPHALAQTSAKRQREPRRRRRPSRHPLAGACLRPAPAEVGTANPLGGSSGGEAGPKGGSSGGEAGPSPPTRSAAARPATLHLVSEPRPHPVPAPLKRVPSPPSGTGSGASSRR